MVHNVVNNKLPSYARHTISSLSNSAIGKVRHQNCKCHQHLACSYQSSEFLNSSPKSKKKSSKLQNQIDYYELEDKFGDEIEIEPKTIKLKSNSSNYTEKEIFNRSKFLDTNLDSSVKSSSRQFKHLMKNSVDRSASIISKYSQKSNLSTIDKRLSKSTNFVSNMDPIPYEETDRPEQHHLTAFMSYDAQCATIKVYEDMIHDELIKIYPQAYSIPRTASPTFDHNSNNSNGKYLRSENETSNINRKSKISHFVDSAMKILDSIQIKKRNYFHYSRGEKSDQYTVKNQPNTNIQSEIDSPLDMYSNWVNSWNKELNLK